AGCGPARDRRSLCARRQRPDDRDRGPRHRSACGAAARYGERGRPGERVVRADARRRRPRARRDRRALPPPPPTAGGGGPPGTGGRKPTARERDLVAGVLGVGVVAIERRAARDQLGRNLAALEDARASAVRQSERLHRQALELAEARDQALASTRAKSEFLAN